MSFAAWERSAFMRPWLPVRAWRRLVLRAKADRFNRLHHSKNHHERIP